MLLRSSSDLEMCRSLLTYRFLLAELCKSLSYLLLWFELQRAEFLAAHPTPTWGQISQPGTFFFSPCWPQAGAHYQVSQLCKDSTPSACWAIEQGWNSALPWYNSQCYLCCLMCLFQRMQPMIKYHVKMIFQACIFAVKTTSFSAQRATKFSEDRSDLS